MRCKICWKVIPRYEQRSFDLRTNSGIWVLIVAPDGSVKIHQMPSYNLAAFSEGQAMSYQLKPGRQVWLQVTRGAATLNGKPLNAGDELPSPRKRILDIRATDGAEILLFDRS